MKATAKVKRANVDGIALDYYRFKIFYKDCKGNDKVVVRWASNADNAIISLAGQYGWEISEHPMRYLEDDHGEALVRVWDREHNHNCFVWLKCFQNDF